MVSQATTFTFTPSDHDLYDLRHQDAYIWGMTSTALRTELQNGMVIESAQILFDDIYDWKVEPDILYFNLLDDTKKRSSSNNVTIISNENPNDSVSNGNYFATLRTDRYQGTTYLTSWTDPNGGSSGKIDLVITLTQAQLNVLASYILDPTASYWNSTSSTWVTGHMFGLGFDPECHYYNNGVTFQVVTGTPKVADGGATVMLSVMAVLMLATVSRRMRR